MIESRIEFFELEDGEKICIRQYANEELTDEILMERHVAIDLANELLEMLI